MNFFLFCVVAVCIYFYHSALPTSFLNEISISYIVFSTFDEDVTSKNITSILKDFDDDVIKVKNVYKPKETAFTNVKLVAKGSW